MNPEKLQEELPKTVKESSRTYFISGPLGAVLFTAAGLLWDRHQFFGSLLLELGGGFFIAFLLEFLLPSAFKYADATAKVLRITELVWSPAAVLSLISYEDASEVHELLEGCQQAIYPVRASIRAGVYDTGTRIEGCRVFNQRISSHSLLYYYVPLRGRLRRGRKRVVIADVTRLSGFPPAPGG